MSDIINIIRAIIQDELKNRQTVELGVVTEVFPFDAESSENNHQVNIKLRSSALELQRVTIATTKIGISQLPQIGDQLLVLFINGDINSPVAIQSVYDCEHNPPVAKADEIVYQPNVETDTEIRRFHMELPSGITITVKDEEVSLKLGDTQLKIEKDGDLTIQAKGNVNLKSDGDVTLSAGGTLLLEGSSEVSMKGPSVGIEGQSEASLKGAQVKIAGLTDFSPS